MTRNVLKNRFFGWYFSGLSRFFNDFSMVCEGFSRGVSCFQRCCSCSKIIQNRRNLSRVLKVISFGSLFKHHEQLPTNLPGLLLRDSTVQADKEKAIITKRDQTKIPKTNKSAGKQKIRTLLQKTLFYLFFPPHTKNCTPSHAACFASARWKAPFWLWQTAGSAKAFSVRRSERC